MIVRLTWGAQTIQASRGSVTPASDAAQRFGQRPVCTGIARELGLFVCGSLACRPRKHLSCSRSRSRLKRHSDEKTSHIQLLVDGDTHSIQEIQSAAEILRQQGWLVTSQIFAEPAREQNRNWKKLFLQPEMFFRPIPRRKDVQGEETDASILLEVRKLCRGESVGFIAFLARDSSFCDAVELAIAKGVTPLVLASSNATRAIRNFKAVGARVLTFRVEGDSGPKVRADLHEDGNGSVRLAEPFTYSYTDRHEEIETIRTFLRALKYGDDVGFLAQSIAKLWFNNQMGHLTVFPTPMALNSALSLVNTQRNLDFRKYDGSLAFVLPVSTTGKMNKAQRDHYGNVHSRAVFRGGGPFIIRDSPGCVAQVLARLGYLDPTWNEDLSEALLTFVNVAQNKKILRKFQSLPDSNDTLPDVDSKLRHSFLSDSCDFEWQVAPKDAEAREILCKQGLLLSPSASQEEVRKAMQQHARRWQLPEMRNYNSYVGQVLNQSRPPDPSKIGRVEFRV